MTRYKEFLNKEDRLTLKHGRLGKRGVRSETIGGELKNENPQVEKT